MKIKNEKEIVVVTSHLNEGHKLIETTNNLNDLYPLPKWIIMDGGSSNKHLKDLEKVQNLFKGNLLIKSEKDYGIYDAWNKAIKYLNDESFVIFLGAGDTILSNNWPQVFNLINQVGNEVNLLCFNIYIKKSRFLKSWKSDFNLTKYEFGRPQLPPHQGVICNSKIIKSLGFDARYQVASDSKFLLQALSSYKYKCFDIYLTVMDGFGVSNNPKKQLKTQKEIYEINRELGLKIPLLHRIKIWFQRRINYAYHVFKMK